MQLKYFIKYLVHSHQAATYKYEYLNFQHKAVPVVFAVLQKRVSISARAVCAHICIPTCHGASRDIILRGEE